jgi:hypothetical protein
MTYTTEQAKAFRSLSSFCPPGFKLTIIDEDNFLTVQASEKDFFSMTGENKTRAVEYMVRVKKALEDNGAIVLLVREGGKED